MPMSPEQINSRVEDMRAFAVGTAKYRREYPEDAETMADTLELYAGIVWRLAGAKPTDSWNDIIQIIWDAQEAMGLSVDRNEP